jgi:5'-3' exonuclease
LNKYLKDNAKKSINITHLSELSGKKIAVDISIYLYKFSAEDALIENIYLMITIFRYYNITPVFIFDGKPPPEKMELLQKRKQDKIEAQSEYNVLQNLLETNIDDSEKQELINNMNVLKKTFVTLKKNDIENVKMLMEAYGVSYYEAKGEADELCAILAIKEKVWACLSEDMDLFVYGCPRIIRYLSLLNHTVVLYDVNAILEEIGLSQKELREICVLSGTDYNVNMGKNEEKNHLNLYSVIKIFNKYKLHHNTEQYNKEQVNIGFYDWLSTQNLCQDILSLQKICNKFDLSENDVEYEQIKIINGEIQKLKIKQILKADGFYFPIHF